MSRPHLNKRYYVLAPLSALLGLLVLIVTITMAIASYLRDIDMTVSGFGHMASSVEASLIHEMVKVNERQLAVLEASLDKDKIVRGEPADSPIWAIAHKFKPGNHYIYFYNLKTDRIDSYPDWLAPPGYQASLRPWYQVTTMPGDEPVWFGPYPEYNTQELILSLIKRVRDEQGQLLGLLMVDMSFDSLQQALQRTVGSNQAALYLTLRDSDQLVVGSNMDLLATHTIKQDQSQQWLGLDVLWHGTYIKRELTDIGWDLNIYLPPVLFRDSLYEALQMVVLPLLLLFAIWCCSLILLVRIFRQEQALVSVSLTDIVCDLECSSPISESKTWFVRRSLNEIDQVRASFLKGQDALLRDPLTGIMNRRAFEQHKAALEQRGEHFWLLLFDVDNFKGVNDSQGHAFGDQVLCRMANCLADMLGVSKVYRIGGDEFAALLPQPQDELAERLSCLLEMVRQQQWRELHGPITLSVGGACYAPAAGPIFERADAALYRSKEAGRNCWHLADEAAD
ncbi:sensor domain-containing diguanylate cyclase [Aeromonas australiensis]|uniref:sensor domain-containing diguanylate cyclase n=1 Tax=Aeromonas australiensis TaxID=1114880 RepID=UPI000589C36C|nr:sensor domain-containing diguanylate cyclase [Aeromonas australiensis]